MDGMPLDEYDCISTAYCDAADARRDRMKKKARAMKRKQLTMREMRMARVAPLAPLETWVDEGLDDGSPW
jgi:hypothetical protein